MIIDELSNLGKYIHLVPELKEVIKFITENDLSLIPDGKVTLDQINGFVNFQTIPAKCDTFAKYESHRKMIDVQIPLTEDEHMLYVPITKIIEEGVYDDEKDIAFHLAEIGPSYRITIRKGMFVIFFPQDVHAPGITDVPLKKAVFKIPV